MYISYVCLLCIHHSRGGERRSERFADVGGCRSVFVCLVCVVCCMYYFCVSRPHHSGYNTYLTHTHRKAHSALHLSWTGSKQSEPNFPFADVCISY